MTQPDRRRTHRTSGRAKAAAAGVVLLLAALAVSALLTVLHRSRSGEPRAARWAGSNHLSSRGGIHKIKHVIIIFQENRSFDSYFGTYPGADGIPMKSGKPTVCLPDPAKRSCIRPYHDSHDRDYGGPHSAGDATVVIDGGRMDRFVTQARRRTDTICMQDFGKPRCQKPELVTRIMGYHDQREIPNYWAYAHRFVLQDHMFEAQLGPSGPAHAYLVSGWSAVCESEDPMSCETSTTRLDPEMPSGEPDFAWTDLTYLLHRSGVSWRYYVMPGSISDCDDGDKYCTHTPQHPMDAKGTPEMWDPLPDFATVHENGQLGNIQPLARFYDAVRAGHLASVTWIAPDGTHSEHPPELISVGQAWVTRIVNAVMRSPVWKSSAIFISWDDWGGFYDHLAPPRVDEAGYGIRVPGLTISPFARRGFIDHQVLSSDAYLRFIEDDFLGGKRLDPTVDGRPDSRPDVRENAPVLGDLTKEFNFSRSPRSPYVLPPRPERRSQ